MCYNFYFLGIILVNNKLFLNFIFTSNDVFSCVKCIKLNYIIHLSVASFLSKLEL